MKMRMLKIKFLKENNICYLKNDAHICNVKDKIEQMKVDCIFPYTRVVSFFFTTMIVDSIDK